MWMYIYIFIKATHTFQAQHPPSLSMCSGNSPHTHSTFVLIIDAELQEYQLSQSHLQGVCGRRSTYRAMHATNISRHNLWDKWKV